jgi:hypothetical protein
MTTDSKDKVDGSSALEQLDGLLALTRRGIELDLRVAAPATVLSFNPITRRADVTLAFLPVLYVEDEEIPQAPIVCPQVPVLMAGDAVSYVTTPILPGSTGLVVFADRCLARFLLSGIPEDPINGRTHSLGDGLFIPTPIGPAVAPVDPTGTVVEGTLVKLGAAATQPAVLGTAMVAALSTYLGAVTTAANTWAGLAPGAPAFATALAAANTALIAAFAATLSTKVVIQ